ncbi:MAG: acetate--CoA ligase [Actinomycetota bacterium]|nr:acetate--CoA ligase [Actinomycetota bacterium]
MAYAMRQVNDKIAVIDKPADLFTVAPNLANYEAAYRDFTWEKARKEIDWFDGGRLNAAYNAVDRHALNWRKNKVALYWEGDRGEIEKYTFRELSELSNKFANALVDIGVGKGDRVFIFLPRLPELYIAFLGILKVGAIAGTLFAAFGPDALRDRLGDSEAKVVITVPSFLPRVDEVISELPALERVVVVDTRGTDVKLKPKEHLYSSLMSAASNRFQAVPMAPEDYAFMLYTSGTTGKSKGVVHAHQALIQEYLTAKWVLDLQEEDIYWCTADPGWVTGISYGILGSWANGVSSVVYEGRFNPREWYRIAEKYEVSVWYTAPTAIRMLMKEGADLVRQFDLSHLRHLASVGEPLNPEAIRWGVDVFDLPFHDNWWQTETGSILIANYPSMPIKLGSMGRPFPGITATIVDDGGNELPPGVPGNLAVKPGWPAMMRTIWKNRAKYDEYIKDGWFISGDKAYRDDDGYFWFIGRADDVIKTGGERVGPFEVESALVEHSAVAEAGVIGKPDMMRGEIIKAFIVLDPGNQPSDELAEEIKQFVKKRLAGHAYPREIEFTDTLPKTQSGKIMRRVLKARELGLPVGDLSTLEV